MTQYHLLSLPSSYIQRVLPPKEELFGVKPHSLDLSAGWGWNRQDDTWKIYWTDIPSVAARCQELSNQMRLKEGLLWEV